MFAVSFVLGFHGCDESVGEKMLANEQDVIVSENRYDWLGAGAYFWENSPDRALEWAQFLMRHPQNAEHKIRKPFVVGAVIDLGNCLDLSDAGSLEIIKEAYAEFKKTSELAGSPLPVNEPAHKADPDLVKRHLDCAVMNYVHALREDRQAGAALEPFDTVRGLFTEGGNYILARKSCRRRTFRFAYVIRGGALRHIFDRGRRTNGIFSSGLRAASRPLGLSTGYPVLGASWRAVFFCIC